MNRVIANIRCPHCQSAIAIHPSTAHNSEIQCPECKGTTVVFREAFVEPPPVIQPTFTVPLTQQIIDHPALPIIGLVCGVSYLLWSVDESPNPIIGLLCYPSLFAVGASATTLAHRKWKWHWTRWAGGALTAAAVFGWGYFDTYQRQWMSDTARYTDTYGQWSGKHLYRELYHYDSEDACHADEYGFDYDMKSEGPMAGTGKLHGL
jgi:hypothetical protein